MAMTSCTKCSSRRIVIQKNFGTNSAHGYVCVDCGYTEIYVSKKTLPRLAAEADKHGGWVNPPEESQGPYR